MNEPRLPIAATCLLVLAELIQTGESPRIEFDLSDPEAIVLTVAFHPRDEIIIELLMESSNYPLDAAVKAFNYVQDHLAENGPTRAEARPACLPGHAHPAICQRRGETVVLVCPADSSVIKRIV